MSHETQQIAYKISEASAITRISKSRLYELIKNGELPYVKIGNSTFLEDKALRELMEKNRRINLKGTVVNHAA